MKNKPSAGKVTKFCLSNAYNNIGKIILANLAWTVCFIPCLLIGMQIRQNFSPLTFLALVVSFLLTAPILGGMFYLSQKIVLNDPYVGMGDFFTGIKKYWGKSLLLLIISLLIPALIVGALIFYGQVAKTQSMGIILWVISLWCLIFFLLTQIYFFPLMITQKMKFGAILKTSLLLALDNPGFTVIIVLVELAFLLLFSFTGIIFIGGVSTICLLQTNAFAELSQKYTGEIIRKERKGERKNIRQLFREIFTPWRYD